MTLLHQYLNAFSSQIGGKETSLSVLKNSKGTAVGICNYGARITHFIFKNIRNQWTDIVLGFNSIDEYIQAKERYHGVTVGPFANRIANGTFNLNGEIYELEQNNGGNCLHGGAVGFHDKVWEVISQTEGQVVLQVKTLEGEGGFPGGMTATVSFTLNDKDELLMEYEAETEADTPVNLTNHAYFNLNGEGSVLQHQVKIEANRFAAINKNCIPVRLQDVEGTPFDFREPKLIEQDIYVEHEQLIIGKGYDHSFELKKENSLQMVHAATALGNLSGIQLDVYTTETAVQFYTGNHLGGLDKGKNNEFYEDRFGFCFETQHHPDSPNQPDFPSTVLKKGEKFISKTIYKIS